MSPEERDDLMQFILECQSSAAREHREIRKDNRELKARQLETMKEIETLAAASRDLLKVAQIHSRRLDRLEGLNR
jgi:hypothetical protein